jgi:hypothetical protein
VGNFLFDVIISFPCFVEKLKIHIILFSVHFSIFTLQHFLDRKFFLQVAPHLYSRSSEDPIPDPLILRKSGSAGNRNLISGSVARNPYHWTSSGSLHTTKIVSGGLYLVLTIIVGIFSCFPACLHYLNLVSHC